MPEYIDRAVLTKSIADEQAVNHVSSGNAGYEIGYHNGLSMAMAMVLKAPAADVVAVVRCMNCKNAQQHPIFPFSRRCKIEDYRLPHRADHFCSYGERRGEDG